MNDNETMNNDETTTTNDYGKTNRLLNEAESAAADLARIYGIDNLIDLKTSHPDRAVLVIAKVNGKRTVIRYGYAAEAADALAYALSQDEGVAKALENILSGPRQS